MLLIVSATIRRDLHRPFRRFKRFRVIHAYHDAAYGDLDAADLGSDTRQYRTLGELRQLIDELQPDLIQGPEPVASRLMFGASWITWQWHRRTSRPYFFPSFENRPLTDKFGPVVGHLMNWWLRVYARSASWIFYLNEGALQNLRTAGVNDEILRLRDSSADESRSAQNDVSRRLIRANWGNWGIDRTEFRPAGRPPHGRAAAWSTRTARTDHQVILFIGRLSTAKGVDTLLDAFGIVRQQLPTVELWLVGPSTLDIDNGPLIDRARQMAGVKLLGLRKQRELPALIQQAWVSVLLSRTTTRWAEQVGMVNLQALACGTPVVTTDSGSIREYVEARGKRQDFIPHTSYLIPHISIHDTNHGSLLVPEDDPAAAAEAILTVLQDRERRETMGRAGVVWIRQTFDEAVNVPKLEGEIFNRWRAMKQS